MRFQNRLSRSFIVSNAPKLLSPLCPASAPAGWTLWEIMKRTKECALCMQCVATHLYIQWTRDWNLCLWLWSSMLTKSFPILSVRRRKDTFDFFHWREAEGRQIRHIFRNIWQRRGRHIFLCQVSLASRPRSQVGANIWSRLWHWSGLEILQEFALCERLRRSTVPSCEEIEYHLGN